jgi:endonuclease YncB( thermonuclease family)
VKTSPLAAMLVLAMAVTAAAGGNTRTVAVVVEPDLVELAGGWRTRIAGVVAPEPETPLHQQALELSRSLLEGELVAIFTWTTDNTARGIVYGPDGLPFAKILCGPDRATDIAEVLLERGLARVDRDHLPPDCGHYRDIERRARERRIGIWAEAD